MQAQGRLAAAKAAPPVTVAPVASRDIVHTFVGVGSVVAPINVKIAPKVSGRLDYLTVREGAAVTPKDVIARINPSQIVAQISQQKAAVAEAQSRLAQAQFTQSPTNVNVTTQIEQQVAARPAPRRTRPDAPELQLAGCRRAIGRHGRSGPDRRRCRGDRQRAGEYPQRPGQPY